MKVIQFSYASVHGTLHCVFFGGWLKSAWDYPSELRKEQLHPWLNLGGTVLGSISGSLSPDRPS